MFRCPRDHIVITMIINWLIFIFQVLQITWWSHNSRLQQNKWTGCLLWWNGNRFSANSGWSVSSRSACFQEMYVQGVHLCLLINMVIWFLVTIYRTSMSELFKSLYLTDLQCVVLFEIDCTFLNGMCVSKYTNKLS